MTKENRLDSTTERTPWSFKERWQIEGILTLITPLHIGDGNTTMHPAIKDDDKLVDITSIIKNYNGKPMIPGSTLKGVLRAWLCRHSQSIEWINAVFGWGSYAANAGTGGKAEFLDSQLTQEINDSTHLPYWRKEYQTYVETSIAVDRYCNTAAHEKLFYQEVIPPGVKFRVVIFGTFDSDDEVQLLLAGLAAFNVEPSLAATLGAGAGNDYGRCTWELKTLKRYDRENVLNWLNNAKRPIWQQHVTKQENIQQFHKKAVEIVDKMMQSLQQIFNFTLKFDNFFLINDSSLEKQEDQANAKPRLTPDGKPLLLASSLRGALRSQAERIVRTLGGFACDPSKMKVNQNDTTSDQGACPPIESLNEFDNRCPVCKLFGAAGWKSPLQFSALNHAKDHSTFTKTQEFVAIDRFTGGGLPGAKFNVESRVNPVFKGQLLLDEKRLHKAYNKEKDNKEIQVLSELGLLALVLRDWQEGDIPIGYGKNKGYGSCSVDITEWQVKKSLINSSVEAFRRGIVLA